jgi:LVIVD repeat-containing protein
MENCRRGILRSYALTLSLLLPSATLASASEQPALKPTDVPATVIAHLPLPQATGSQMLLQRENGKHYLYVQQAGKQGFMVVDVSNPEKPNLLKRTAESNQSTSGNLALVSPDVAIAEAPEKTPTTLTSSSRPTETVRVLDLSDPRNPKTLETFNKVTSILPDGGHSLIFVTNNEGLWILRYNHPSLLEPAKKKPPCDSESEIMAMPPDCD